MRELRNAALLQDTAGVHAEQRNRFVQYQYTDWINQTSSTGSDPSQKPDVYIMRTTTPNPLKYHLFVINCCRGTSQPVAGLLPDNEVVEVDTLLVLLLDLADDGAEVLDVLDDSNGSVSCFLKDFEGHRFL